MTTANEKARAQCLRIGMRYISLCKVARVNTSETVESVADALITVTTRGGVNLNLDTLEHSPSQTLAHDVGGILRYSDRYTGKLTGRFYPITTH